MLIDKTASLAENNRQGGHTTASRSMSRGIVRTRPLRILSPNDVDQIHTSSLDVLDQIGIKIYSERALNILNDAGADVDFRAGVAKIPSHLVQEALDKCKRPVRLSGRNPKYDFTLDDDHVHLCTDGSGIGVLDLETGQRRDSTKKDVEDCARIADYLEYLNIYYPLVTPLDVPKHSHVLHELDAAFNNCEKHVTSGTTYLREEAIFAVKMAQAVAGGEYELRKRPLLSAVVCTSSPLVLGLTTDAAIEFARAGVPPIVMTMPLVGASSPVTLAGPITLGNAQVLALITVLQLDTPGSPVIYSSVPMAMEPMTGLFAAAFPAATMVTLAHIQMSKHYRLPILVGGWGSCSKIPDEQAAYEKSIMGYSMVLAGADINSGPGLLENYTILSYEQLMLDHEMYTMMLETLKGIEVSDETIAMDVCAKVGHEGHFLGQKHTIQHFKELWMPTLSNPRPYQAWAKDGSKNVVRVAGEKVKQILATHKVEPLSRALQDDLARIIHEGEEAIPR
ncbi:MAG: trimethylamine methyltransferase family protein [Thermoplasmata archaeon]